MNSLLFRFALTCSALSLVVAPVRAATETPHPFTRAQPDPFRGDWQGGDYVAQVSLTPTGDYQVAVLQKFDQPGAQPLATLTGRRNGEKVEFSGDDWKGVASASGFTLSRGADQVSLKHVERASPTLDARPPKDAIVLFDGHDFDAWAKKAGKDWLKADGDAPWKRVEGGAMEVVPQTDSLISRQSFGDCHLHVEYRTLGTPTNSGVFLQARYEVNINETYGRFDGTPTAGLDNCTPADAKPRIRAARPPLEWQTLDIDFTAPRFDAGGKKVAPARATVVLNGVTIYHEQPLKQPKGAASRLGEAPTGPILLQEHGAPLQFRNLWLVPKHE